MAEHSTLTGASLHEPKGVAAASANTVYTADGAASGAWQKVTSSMINSSSVFDVNKGYYTGAFADVSTADEMFFPFPFAATVTRVTTVLGGAITVGDSTLTVTKTGGSSLGTITVAQSGSAEGDVDTLTPVANNTLTAGQYIKIACDGGSTDAQRLGVMVEFTRTS